MKCCLSGPRQSWKAACLWLGSSDSGAVLAVLAAALSAFPPVMQEADTGSSLKLVQISITQLTLGPTLAGTQL